MELVIIAFFACLLTSLVRAVRRPTINHTIIEIRQPADPARSERIRTTFQEAHKLKRRLVQMSAESRN